MSNLNALVNRSIFDDLFRDVSSGYFIRPLHGDPLPNQIKVDIKENADAFIVQAEIPGTTKENIQVDIDRNTVSIRGHIQQEDSQSKDDKTLRTERYFGEVSRSFQLSSEVEEHSSKARYEHGVLTLTLIKKHKKGGQRISIE